MSSYSSSRLAAGLQIIVYMTPGIALAMTAMFIRHPLLLSFLLLAQAPLAAGVVQVLGYRLDQGFIALALRRGVVLLVWLALYAALVAVVIGYPIMRLITAGTALNALLLSAGFLIVVLALIRFWPVFGLALLWDDAYPEQEPGSWIVTALRRTWRFSWHLTGDSQDHRFGSGLVVTFSVLLLIIPALLIAGLCGVLPSELHELAVLIYALVVCPVAHLLLLWRTEHLLLSDEVDEAEAVASHFQPEAKFAIPAEPVTLQTNTLPEESPISLVQVDPIKADVTANPERNALFLNAAANGNAAQVLELLQQGVDPNLTPGRNDRDQRSALMSAATHSDLRLLRVLIAHGANPNLAINGLTPLLLAVRDSLMGRPDAVMTLLANGADVAHAGTDGNTPLHHAVVTREPGIAAMLLDAGAPVEAVNAEGLTPLGMAARSGNEALVQLLLARRANPDPERGLSALIAAAGAVEDLPKLSKRLLKARANVHAIDKLGRSALHVAALHGHAEVTEALIGAGAEVNAQDAQGVTPLMEAARAGANRVLQRLLFRHPDPECADRRGRTALHLACQSRQANIDTLRMLLAIGVDPESKSRDGKRAVDLAAAAGRWQMVLLLDSAWPVPEAIAANELRDSSDSEAQPVSEAERLRLLQEALQQGRLLIAAGLLELEPRIEPHRLVDFLPGCLQRDDAAAITMLLRHGLDNDRGAGLTPLLLEAVAYLPLPLAIIGTLLQTGAAPGGGMLLPFLAGAIDETVRERRILIESIALTMIERGADLFASDSQGSGLLHYAARGSWVNLLATGLHLGLDPNQCDHRGYTPLHIAISRENDSVLANVQILLRHGADPERPALDGQTSLGLALQHMNNEIIAWLRWNPWQLPGRKLLPHDLPAAAAIGDLAAVRKLIALGLEINAQDMQGCTALLRASGAGHPDLVDWLLRHDADHRIAARTGATSLSAAVSAGQHAIVTRLIAAGAAVDQIMPGGITSLLIAAALGADTIAQVLLLNGADAKRADENGHTALHAAAQVAWASIETEPVKRLIQLLLDNSADINAPNHDGSTPLLFLLGARVDPGSAPVNTQTIRQLLALLLANGADVDVQDRRGVSVLHAAAMHGMAEVLAMLLTAGADPRRRDALGRTPHDVAVLLGYVDLAASLRYS